MTSRIITSLLLATLFTACRHRPETTPIRKDIVDAVFGSGHIENKDQYAVMANQEGYLVEANLKEGDSVKKGQPLYRLTEDIQQTQVRNALDNLNFARTNAAKESPNIQQLEIQIVQAKAKTRNDSLTYARYQRLAATHAISTSDMENAQIQYTASVSNQQVLEKNLADLKHNLNLNIDNARSQYAIQQQTKDYFTIRAKADGIIFTLIKKTGDYIKKGDQIATIGAGTPIIKLNIAEDDIRRIKPGQTALISLNSIKDSVYKAIITRLYPAFDNTQQAFIVEAQFQQWPSVLINGTQLQGNIILEEKKNALIIPSYYLLPGDSVEIRQKKVKVPVKTGIRTLEYTEIVSGLTENDILIQPKTK